MMLALAVGAAVPLFVLARRGELGANPERFVGVIVGFLIIECLLYPAQTDVPVGPFRIPFLGGNIRTHDYLVVIGILARATARPAPRHVSRTGVLWFLAFVWLATAAARGILAGHQTNAVLFSAMSLVGLFGSRVLVGGCTPERLIALLRGRWVVPLAAVMLFLIPNSAGGAPRTFFGTDFGGIHVDTASVFVAIGSFVLLVEWSSRRRGARQDCVRAFRRVARGAIRPSKRPQNPGVCPRQRWLPWACLPLLATPFTIEQRATLAHVGGTVLVIGWAMTRSRWSSVMRIPRAQLAWGVAATVAVAMVVLIVHLNRQDSSLPFAGYYEGTFSSEGNQLSGQARLEGLEFGLDEWAAAPIYGHGLGQRYDIVRPGVGLREVGTFDNVPLDVLVRSGLVGLLLFGAAAIATLRDGIKVWRSDPRATVASLALAAVAVLVGLGTKSLFESILEKGKLALTIGLSAGVIAAVTRSQTSRSDPTTPRDAASSGRDGTTQPDEADREPEAQWI